MDALLYDVIGRNPNSILEMVTENTLTNVPVHPNINIDVITAGDPEPKFVNVEVIRSNATSGNGRRYGSPVVKQIGGMIPGLQGYLGHPDPAKYGFEFREPQCIYVGSLIEEMGNGIVRVVAKAYLFTTSKLREWIPKSIAAGNPMTISINGRGDVIRGTDYVDVVQMTKMDSIDWANPGTEGIDTSKAMSVVRELNQNNNNGGIEMEVKDILKNTTVTEIKAYNPDAYTGIVKSVTVAELREHNPLMVKEIENGVIISELTLNIDGEKKTVKITELQGTIDSLIQEIAGLKAKESENKLKDFKSAKIVELIPEELREQISKRISGKTEDEIVASINSEITYIREMRGLGSNEPLGQQRKASTGEDYKDVAASIFGLKQPDKK